MWGPTLPLPANSRCPPDINTPVDSLNDVVIILASNRADLIDPAILRPGRIDRKIKVNRPNKHGARDIYRIYLTDDLPYDGALAKEADNVGAAIEQLVERFVDWQFAKREENKFLEVTLRSGRKETLYRSDLNRNWLLHERYCNCI